MQEHPKFRAYTGQLKLDFTLRKLRFLLRLTGQMAMRVSTPHSTSHGFTDRADAGTQLAELLSQQPIKPDTVVLALPRGGLPIGVAIAVGLTPDIPRLAPGGFYETGSPRFAAGGCFDSRG